MLLVLINKGRLCIYFCLLVHRRAVSGWPERVLLQLCGKLTQVLLSETCPSHLRLELFAFSLSLTHRHAHRHTDTRVPPRPGAPPWWGPAQRGPCSPSLPPRGSAWPSCFSRRLLQTQKHIPLLRNGRERGSQDRFYGVKSLPRLHWNTHKNYAVQPAGTKK